MLADITLGREKDPLFIDMRNLIPHEYKVSLTLILLYGDYIPLFPTDPQKVISQDKGPAPP